MRRFFVPDKEKCEAFLRAQKNVLEQNRTKGVSPTAVLRKPSPEGGEAHTILLCEVAPFIIFLYFLFYPLEKIVLYDLLQFYYIQGIYSLIL